MNNEGLQVGVGKRQLWRREEERLRSDGVVGLEWGGGGQGMKISEGFEMMEECVARGSHQVSLLKKKQAYEETREM